MIGARLWVANRAIFASAGSLVGSAAITSGLGFVYWWVAARQFTPEAVGFAAAAVSAMSLLGTVGMFGLGTLLILELPRHSGGERPLMTAAVAVSGCAGAGIGLLFATAAGFAFPNLQPLGASVASTTLFGAGVGLTSIALVVDQGLIGLSHGELQLGRNAVFAVAKLAMLLVASIYLGTGFWLAIFATFVGGLLMSLLGLAALPSSKLGLGGHVRPEWGALRGLRQAALAHHALNLALAAPLLILPVIVTVQLSAAMAAYFYTASMIVGFVLVGPVALTTGLYAAASRSPAQLAARIRFTLGLSALTGVLAVGLLLVVAGPVLRAFGQDYAEQATTSLRIMCLTVFPLIIKDHYVIVCRVQDRVGRATLFVAIGGLVEVSLAAGGARVGGLSGLSLAWLCALSLEALFMVAVVRETARLASHPAPASGV